MANPYDQIVIGTGTAASVAEGEAPQMNFLTLRHPEP